MVIAMRTACLMVTAVFCVSGAVSAAGFQTKPAAARAHRVQISHFNFQTPTLTVHVGDTVVWKNSDIVPHTVTDLNKAFDSGAFAPGASWRLIAKTPGTFHYECTLHPNMEGTLIVVNALDSGK
jgi:plastocyanin